MDILIYLIPVALLTGALLLALFIWSFKSGQYDDLSGDSMRILRDEDTVIPNKNKTKQTHKTHKK